MKRGCSLAHLWSAAQCYLQKQQAASLWLQSCSGSTKPNIVEPHQRTASIKDLLSPIAPARLTQKQMTLMPCNQNQTGENLL